ncbi:acriflavine sensitivity control protein Acr-2 [Colletotrichum tofieldiae]|uniref:Acriflavine sensitivity control protein Acr-2 n=1 Tax=Colletotrichum tofieldiae TaxID=708197 RepID=A0A166TZC6_9PEZI|nr:acriflavine sensitivity control protein Acr-2 [Colletotrichum tofieldiae]
MVMDAVLAVSAFHVSGTAIGQHAINPDRLYARAISQLSNRKNLVGWNSETNQLVILVIVVLLVSVMVNGLPDFPIVFQMLESAIDAVGGDEVLAEGGEMGEFLLRQIRKMRVYAAPLVSEDAGVDAIVYHAQESFDCLYYYHGLYPDHCLTFGLIADIRQHAFNMYLRRVLPDDSELKPAASSDELIKSFRKSLESFPEGTLGEHILIWPTFIAALECRTQEQRLFFECFLLRQYHRNRFMNIPKALEFLRGVWLQDGVQVNWPALIPELRVFIM